MSATASAETASIHSHGGTDRGVALKMLGFRWAALFKPNPVGFGKHPLNGLGKLVDLTFVGPGLSDSAAN